MPKIVTKNILWKYTVIMLAFISCNDLKRNESLKISTEVLDTIRSRPSRVDAKPLLFEAAFIKGSTHRVKDATVNFYGITIGKLKIVSGTIVACDPGHIDEYGIPFTQVFPKGEYPVQLAIANVENEEAIAFARINFSDAPVERWELALQEGQSPLPVGGNKMHGYSVDLGVGMFADQEASKAVDKTKLTDLDAELYLEMDKHYHNGWRYTMHHFGQHNLAVFSSGFGDGYYGSYIGFDAQGSPCRLVTDFNVVNWKGR